MYHPSFFVCLYVCPRNLLVLYTSNLTATYNETCRYTCTNSPPKSPPPIREDLSLNCTWIADIALSYNRSPDPLRTWWDLLSIDTFNRSIEPGPVTKSPPLAGYSTTFKALNKHLCRPKHPIRCRQIVRVVRLARFLSGRAETPRHRRYRREYSNPPPPPLHFGPNKPSPPPPRGLFADDDRVRVRAHVRHSMFRVLYSFLADANGYGGRRTLPSR